MRVRTFLSFYVWCKRSTRYLLPTIQPYQGIVRAYYFVLDFLEAIANETSGLMKRRQATLKKIMEAAKVSEIEVDKIMRENNIEVRSHYLIFMHSSMCYYRSDSLLFFLGPGIRSRISGVS